MKRYQCYKTVEASVIHRVNAREGGACSLNLDAGTIEMPAEWVQKHNPQVGGYFVQYADGYQSYSPAKAFETGYHIAPTTGMSFGEAISAVKGGLRVQRAGWNGKGMFVVLIHPGNAMYTKASHGTFPMLPCLGMKTAQGEMLPGWLASQTDILADDWRILKDGEPA